MKNKDHKSVLIREQLQKTFKKFKVLEKRKSKRSIGWVRSIRQALGMSSRQLADRIHVEPPRITELEKAELTGNITLRSLRRVAEAMDCDLVYALVPKTSLEETVRKQAVLSARQRLEKVSHTMLLEDQSLKPKQEEKILEARVEGLVRDLPRWLWDSK